MNKKERRKALFCVLSSKLRDNKLIIVDDIKLQEIKTKKMLELINNLPIEKTALLALGEKNEIIEKSLANLANVKSILVDYLNIADLLKYKSLILLKASLEKINALAK
jgi:large subunit ribosomal protein L4